MTNSLKAYITLTCIITLTSCATYHRPAYLQNGDLVGIVNLSSRINPAADTALVRRFVEDSMGFRVRFGKHLLDQTNPSFGADDSVRAADFMDMTRDPEVRAILLYRGGYGAVRTLDHINWRTIGRDPKWMVGFSDVTMLHLAANAHPIETIHGAIAAHFPTDSIGRVSVRQALMGKLTATDIPSHPLNQKGIAQGRLVGGNLSIMYAASGTKQGRELLRRDAILLIEDVGEKLYHIDRMLQNLERTGVLKRAKAIVIGHMTRIDKLDEFGVSSAEELIAQYTKKYGIPVIFGFPSGHESPNVALYMGRQVRVSVTDSGAQLEFL